MLKRRSQLKRTEFKRRLVRRRRAVLRKSISEFSKDEDKNSAILSGKETSRRNGRSGLRAGKKTKEWDRVRAVLKVEYEAAGITECELGYEGCKRDDWLSFAHGLKRRHLQGDQLKTLTILSCTVCHDRIERLSEADMCAIVESVIRGRKLAA